MCSGRDLPVALGREGREQPACGAKRPQDGVRPCGTRDRAMHGAAASPQDAAAVARVTAFRNFAAKDMKLNRVRSFTVMKLWFAGKTAALDDLFSIGALHPRLRIHRLCPIHGGATHERIWQGARAGLGVMMGRLDVAMLRLSPAD